jgi:DNA-binding CsgD family transcriptional regulator
VARDRSGPNEQREQLAAAERAAAEALSFDELGEDALRAIQQAIGASNALLYRYDEQGIVHGLSGSLSSAIPTYAAELFPTDPVQHHLMRVNPAERAVIRLQDLDPLTYRKSAAYNEFYQPHDVHHLLGLWLTSLPYGAPGMAGILFTRAAFEPDFSAAEARTLTHALPTFRAAVRRVDRVDRNDRERRALEGVVSALAPGAYLALDRTGRLLWSSPAADAMLSQARGRGEPIPSVLRDAAARLGALASGGLPAAPPPFQVEIPAAGRHIAAELRLGRSTSGEPVVAVTLTAHAPLVEDGSPMSSPMPMSSPTPPSSQTPMSSQTLRKAPASFEALADRYKLTRAEQAVAACLGEGLSNRDIAARLFVSVETVKTHVQRVLAKLEVASRTQAAVKVAAG